MMILNDFLMDVPGIPKIRADDISVNFPENFMKKLRLKTAPELKKYKRSKIIESILFKITIFLFTSILMVIAMMLGRWGNPPSLMEALKNPFPYIFGLVVSIAGPYIWNLKDPDIVICLKCEKSKVKDDIVNCECGGLLLPIEEVTWDQIN